jgi:hypothetical protein
MLRGGHIVLMLRLRHAAGGEGGALAQQRAGESLTVDVLLGRCSRESGLLPPEHGSPPALGA